MLCVIFGLIELALAIYGGYKLVQVVRVWIDQRAGVWINEAIDIFEDWRDSWWPVLHPWASKRAQQYRLDAIRRGQTTAPSEASHVMRDLGPAWSGQSTDPHQPYGAVSDGGAVTTVTPEPIDRSDYQPEPQYKPRRAYEPTRKTSEAEGFETQPFTTSWQGDLLSKAEMTESMLILEADDGKTFTVDDAALPDYVHELQKNGYDVEVSRMPDSDPAQYVLKLKKRRRY